MTDWHKTVLGQTILQCERDVAARLLPKRFYRVCVQVEGTSRMDYLQSIDYQLLCNVVQQPSRHDKDSVLGTGEWLPFGENSIDLLILPHVIEFSQYPHDVLREATICLCSSGVLLITGFNPHSLLSFAKKLNQLDYLMPREIVFHPVHRIREWLMLLGFEVCAGEFAFYRPPVKGAEQLSKLSYMETAGVRWWPAMGSVYILVARKQDLGIRIKSRFANRRLSQHHYGLETQ